MSAGMGSIDPALRAALQRLGLIAPGEAATFIPLSGGVSSDIWLVDTATRRFCVKRALPKLKVEQDWRAPVERSRYEYDWLEVAGGIVPSAVPMLYGYDAEAQLFALEYLEPGAYRWWKGELRGGVAEPPIACAVGHALARIHAGTADRADIAARFRTGEIFHAIRLEPYLVAAATQHPDLAGVLDALVRRTAATQRVLVHGDVSPKNILVGPQGPVLLDAECAWYGDPAFDLAFCLNHMLLKCLWTPHARDGFLSCFDALAAEYLCGVTWEPRAGVEARAAHLLAGLFLARVDGKSPAEYVTEDADKVRIRRIARRFLKSPAARLATIRDAWARELSR